MPDQTTSSPEAVADAARYFDSWLAFRREHGRLPGVQAAIWHGDGLALSSAHGHADVESDTALTTRHLFRIASHSKTFTATAAMQLVEDGKLRLDDTAGSHLPWLVEADSPLAAATVRELLAHAGGVVRDGWDGDHWQLAKAFPDVEELQRVTLDAADVLPRNERFKYSNVGYSLAGLVIEAVAGRGYADQVTERIIDPLGLADTGPEYDPDRSTEYATGYSSLSYSQTRIPIDHVDTAAMAPATGFYATAEDVVRYMAAHFPGDDTLLDDDSKRILHRTEWEVEGTDTSYGLGFGISKIGDRRLLGHGGGYPGHITRTVFDPADRLAVSVLTNAIDGPAQTYAYAAVHLVDLAAGNSPASSSIDPLPSSEASRFSGRFATLWGPFDVADLGGRLYRLNPLAEDPTAEAAHLERIDDHTLRIARDIGYASHGEVIEYDFADDGTVRSVRGGSGSTAYPIEAMREAVGHRDRVGPGAPLTP